VSYTGPDVSSFQGDVDWHKVRSSGHVFAIVKATEGLDFVDPKFTAARWKAMRAAKLHRGAYHFARPQPGRTGAQEAAHFVRAVKHVGGRRHGSDFPLILDIEWAASGMAPHSIWRWCSDFCSYVRRHTGRGCIVYTGSFWRDRVGNIGPPRNGGVLWLAAYVQHPDPLVPRGFKQWTLWQRTDKAHVPGISTPCDLSLFRGGRAKLLWVCR
jgi:lysozyme